MNINIKSLTPVQFLALEKYVELLRLKNYSENTVVVYPVGLK